MTWRFLLRPKWIIGHLLIIAVVVLFGSLSHWQFDRLHQRKAENRAIRSQINAPALELSSSTLPADARQYRKVRITGTWQPEATVYERYPVVNGQPGFYVLEPLRFESGSAVLVNRGWIPLDVSKNNAKPAAAKGATVTIEGLLLKPEHTTKAVGATNANPPIPTVDAIDLGEISKTTGAVAPMYVQLTAPAGPTDPQPLDAPEISERSHFSYALQWIGFACIAVLGWAIVLYREAQAGARHPGEGPRHPGEGPRHPGEGPRHPGEGQDPSPS